MPGFPPIDGRVPGVSPGVLGRVDGRVEGRVEGRANRPIRAGCLERNPAKAARKADSQC